jgi:hypothetical protein
VSRSDETARRSNSRTTGGPGSASDRRDGRRHKCAAEQTSVAVIAAGKKNYFDLQNIS